MKINWDRHDWQSVYLAEKWEYAESASNWKEIFMWLNTVKVKKTTTCKQKYHLQACRFGKGDKLFMNNTSHRIFYSARSHCLTVLLVSPVTFRCQSLLVHALVWLLWHWMTLWSLTKLQHGTTKTWREFHETPGWKVRWTEMTLTATATWQTNTHTYILRQTDTEAYIDNTVLQVHSKHLQTNKTPISTLRKLNKNSHMIVNLVKSVHNLYLTHSVPGTR